MFWSIRPLVFRLRKVNQHKIYLRPPKYIIRWLTPIYEAQNYRTNKHDLKRELHKADRKIKLKDKNDAKYTIIAGKWEMKSKKRVATSTSHVRDSSIGSALCHGRSFENFLLRFRRRIGPRQRQYRAVGCHLCCVSVRSISRLLFQSLLLCLFDFVSSVQVTTNQSYGTQLFRRRWRGEELIRPGLEISSFLVEPPRFTSKIWLTLSSFFDFDSKFYYIVVPLPLFHIQIFFKYIH